LIGFGRGSEPSDAPALSRAAKRLKAAPPPPSPPPPPHPQPQPQPQSVVRKAPRACGPASASDGMRRVGAVLRCAVLCCAVLCCAVLCCAALCCCGGLLVWVVTGAALRCGRCSALSGRCGWCGRCGAGAGAGAGPAAPTEGIRAFRVGFQSVQRLVCRHSTAHRRSESD
jgi:hypothetical protein